MRTRAVVRPFIERMGDAYRLADLVVARAGAMTLAELSVCGKASILVPFPHATHNHQQANARDLVEAGAAVMILDRDLQGELLAEQIAKLIDTPRKLREMSNNALIMARPDAAAKIAEALMRLGGATMEGAGDGGGRPPTATNGATTPVASASDENSRRPRGRRGRRSS
jgi:UDP-N-acetylglucosamine--N-acetylmuramyl-(pentapeptide) pyrophosphoryl-undecaprenol N-acetylglucosamine transferase